MLVCLKKKLQDSTIGLIPPNGYRRAEKHSQKSIELLYCEHEIGRPIIHAGRSREFRLQDGHLVDGCLAPLPTQSTDRVPTLTKESFFNSKAVTCMVTNSIYKY